MSKWVAPGEGMKVQGLLQAAVAMRDALTELMLVANGAVSHLEELVDDQAVTNLVITLEDVKTLDYTAMLRMAHCDTRPKGS